MNLNETHDLTVAWAEARNLIDGSDAKTQTLKLGSEFGELCDNIAKGRYYAAKDDIGDMVVVLTIVAQQIGSSLEECFEVAYNDIKDRRGRMVNGTFIKENDLSLLEIAKENG